MAKKGDRRSNQRNDVTIFIAKPVRHKSVGIILRASRLTVDVFIMIAIYYHALPPLSFHRAATIRLHHHRIVCLFRSLGRFFFAPAVCVCENVCIVGRWFWPAAVNARVLAHHFNARNHEILGIEKQRVCNILRCYCRSLFFFIIISLFLPFAGFSLPVRLYS